MQIQDIKYLKCIGCNGRLELAVFSFDKSDGQECVDGKLACTKCKKTYPVIGGVPRIFADDLLLALVVPAYLNFFREHGKEFKQVKKNRKANVERLKKRTADSFSFEWLEYNDILGQFEKDWKRYFNPFITKEGIKNKVVADFGCGMAKHGYFAGKYKSKKYIGLDLSLAADAAYKNTKKFKPLIVQCDIYAPPLRGEEVDIFYSIGVLHHLPDPEGGFLSMTSLMKKGSEVFIWVYGKHKNARALYLYNPIRVLTTRLPRFILHPLCHIPALGVHAINIVQKGLDGVGLKRLSDKIPFSYYKSVPYMFKVSDSFDVFATPKQIYYEMQDIEQWFKDAKIKDFDLEFDDIQGIKGFGKK